MATLPPYCCLESPIDRGAWWATVRGVTKSQTQLKRPSTHEQSGHRPWRIGNTHCLELVTITGRHHLLLDTHCTPYRFRMPPTPPVIVLKVTLQDAISISRRRGLRCSEVQQITKWGQGGRSGFQAQVCRMPLSFLLSTQSMVLGPAAGASHRDLCVCLCVFS